MVGSDAAIWVKSRKPDAANRSTSDRLSPARSSAVPQIVNTTSCGRCDTIASALSWCPGHGRLLPDLLRYADALKYVGIDISQTMVDEARQFNAPLVATGQAAFHLAGAEDIPSGPASFDRVFAVNVIYFWANPHRPLEEVRRVLRPGGFSVIAAVTPETAAATPILRPEFGFPCPRRCEPCRVP